MIGHHPEPSASLRTPVRDRRRRYASDYALSCNTRSAMASPMALQDEVPPTS